MTEEVSSAPTAGMSEAVTNPVITNIPAAPAETVAPQSAETPVTPQAEKPAGTEDQEQQAKPEDLAKDEAEKARKAERSKERWQAKNRELAESRRRETFLLGELERLNKQQPDLSQITDPNERFVKQTAAEVRSGQIEDTRARAQQEQHIRAAAVQEAWGAIQEEMRAKAPDFDQVVTERTPIHQRAAPFIVESEKGGEIAYWLGKNPDAARDLYQKFETAPAQALMELGRIEARLSAAPPKQVSTAPKPAPVLNGGVSPLGFDIDRASVADVAAQLKKRGLIR